MIDQKLKARALHRAKIIKGQMEGLIRAIEREEYCHGLMLQSLSIQRSLKSLDHLMLEDHLKVHVIDQMQQPKGQAKAVRELLELYTLSVKS